MTGDPAALARACHEAAERSARILGDFAQKSAAGLSSAVRDELGIAKAFMDLYARAAADPSVMAALSVNLWVDYSRLWHSSWMKLFGVDARPVAEPAQGDSRFKDDDWSEHFVFDLLKQSYLIAARHIQHAVAGVEGLPEDSEKKVAFFTRQYVDALSPTNFVLTNPQVLRETAASGGQNLVRGLNNLLADIEKGNGELRISMTDEAAFRLGSNVATTPGKVVYQNDLMQLIQYQPATADVYRRPLVIVPPWINKYYILDLREKNSFIRWAVQQGRTVFVVSWVNPDGRLAQKGFDDYMLEGPLAALDAVERATGETKVDFIGYCLGGTLLGGTLAYLAAKGEDRVGCASYFVSLLDFSQPGELGVFIDEEQVANLERRMNERGYLEGSEMAGTFNLLRANDLVWSFVINNYLLGKDPFPFDLLYWNSDSTRMPARMHSFYLRNMYIRNLLGVPGGISLAGVPVDLSNVRLPSYFISTVEDHIAPWKTTYRGARYLGGAVRFVLGGSGHIAGIVNPPAAKKYHYWTNEAFPESADAWFAGAAQHPGSWWEDWQAWMDAHSSNEPRVPARVPGEGGLKALEDAPGSYAMLRLGKS
ncbi:MAG: class I poly(R)-hydroxyalkanoic acid synthase [Betaproteobacteria bacterium RIFCSPHIGHO2_12_FULL_69_13]|nr:MAG: class I poly(R)-hydroxyalkanoic acid synthase [Betaproteobacteria bacterium RIFCSPHIGHO2_12_FULL_69_13]OGA65720.1 MAG: class I poly(R)-hydroxyalkanoic acid synthase [Betaproteobacteria bacterium RIFCSPLOWO2_12_FULL_68_20]